jgi:hypothetical protein
MLTVPFLSCAEMPWGLQHPVVAGALVIDTG